MSGRWLFSVVVLGLGVFFFLIPGIRLACDLNDPALTSVKIPHAAWRLYRNLTPLYAKWARERLASGRVSQGGAEDVSGTEWPLFGSVFYLWSLESLQQSWQADPTQAPMAPVLFARPAIEAAVDLVMDPNQAAWVRQYWGDGYLHRQDLFYRFLQISAMTSYTHLTGNPRYLPQLRDQVETLSAEIDASPSGWLEDYPGQCFPTDVIGAIAAIHRADDVLKTDHSAFVQRALRGFVPPHTDDLGLPPYNGNAARGVSLSQSRGCGNSFAFIFTPEIWPAASRAWYQNYEDHFWQHRMGLVGFCEFPRNTPPSNISMDVDSGPLIFGFGFAASAFGVGTARAQGRMDEAGPLTAEMLVSLWPVGSETLLLPRLLSNATDAPYLGEAGILFSLTRLPVDGVGKNCLTVLTPFVWVVMALYFGLALLFASPFLQLLWNRVGRRPKLALGR